MPIPMMNHIEAIRSIPTIKYFEIDGLVIAQFSCFAHDDIGVWTQTDYFIHVLNSEVSWRTSSGTHTAYAGESVFFKKGVRILTEHGENNLCLEMFFIPDSIIKDTVRELAKELPSLKDPAQTDELSIRINSDTALSAFLHAMTIYFASNEQPPVALLKLKIKELLTTFLLNRSNPSLAAYLRSIGGSDSPSISSIMEANFQHNLSLDAFAEMCHRSLSSFKREFQKTYGTSPGKWLVERRLKHSASLLRKTGMSITEICLESGFEDVSHFSRTFREKFGQTPSNYRESISFTG